MKLHTIELMEFEKIVPRGVSKQTWVVRLNHRWVQACKVPNAMVVNSQGQRGVVWERRVQLGLEAGTLLRSMTEEPNRTQHKDVFSIMTVDTRSSTRVQQAEYEVSATGHLSRRIT